MNANNKKCVEALNPSLLATSPTTSAEAANNDKKEKTKWFYKKWEPKDTNIKTATYQKLVVPKRMQSPYWKYFGFPASDNGDLLTQDQIICLLCKKQLAYKKNTTNLQSHLKWMHKTELMIMGISSSKNGSPKKRHGKNDFLSLATHEDQVDVYKTVSRVTPEVYLQGEINKNVGEEILTNVDGQTSEVFQNLDNSSSNMINKVVSDAIIAFLITDLHLPDIVEGKGFQRLIGSLRSPCEIPGKYKLEHDIIPRIYEYTRTDVLNCIKNSYNTFSLGIEEWKCTSGNVYVTISVFFQQLDKEDLCIKQLATLLCNPNRTHNQWSEILVSLLINWNINIDHVKSVIKAFSNKGLDSALRNQGFVIIPCLVYELQNLCTTFCFETEEVSEVLIKCRAISYKLHHHTLTSVTVQNNVIQVVSLFLSQEYPQIWTTIYHNLECFVSHKDNIIKCCNILSNIEILPHELLTDKDWSVIEDVVTTLRPLNFTVNALSEQKFPLISLIKPFITQLTSHHLKVECSDSNFAAGLKNRFIHELYWKYSDINVQIFLHISTLLDPRFKNSPIIEGEENLPTIKQELIKMLETEKSVMHESELNITKDYTYASEKTRVSGINYLLGRVASAKTSVPNNNIMSLEDRLNLEIAQYKSEQEIPRLDGCPLLWWSQMSSKCQNLIRLARKHFVYALSGTSSKLPHESQKLYYIKRSQFNQDLVDKMMFINANLVENNC